MSLTTEQVWQDFRLQIRSFLLRRVRDEALADDLLQETFIRIHRGLESIRIPGRVLPWLLRVARNVISDHYRQHSFDGKEFEPVDWNDLETAQNHNRELGRWLAGVARTLPEKYRSAFELVEIKGWKQREMANELGLTLSGAKSRVQRARAMLRRSLLDCCEVEFDRRGNAIDYRPRNGCNECSTAPVGANHKCGTEPSGG